MRRTLLALAFLALAGTSAAPAAAQLNPNILNSGGCAFATVVCGSWEITMMGNTATVEFNRTSLVTAGIRRFFIVTDAGTRTWLDPFGGGFFTGNATETNTLTLPAGWTQITDVGYTAERIINGQSVIRQVVATPEPATIALTAGGLLALGGVGLRQRRRAAA